MHIRIHKHTYTCKYTYTQTHAHNIMFMQTDKPMQPNTLVHKCIYRKGTKIHMQVHTHTYNT